MSWNRELAKRRLKFIAKKLAIHAGASFLSSAVVAGKVGQGLRDSYGQFIFLDDYLFFGLLLIRLA